MLSRSLQPHNISDTLTHDRGSNITSSDDAVAYGLDAGAWSDAAYSVDDLGRLTSTREGELVSGVISTGDRTREELWTTLSPTGNWKQRKLDLNGDGDYSDTGELDDTGTFNLANEWLTRDTDSNSSVNHTLTHDAAGNMTDDGSVYKLVYDAFGRVKEVKNRSSNALVTRYVSRTTVKGAPRVEQHPLGCVRLAARRRAYDASMCCGAVLSSPLSASGSRVVGEQRGGYRREALGSCVCRA